MWKKQQSQSPQQSRQSQLKAEIVVAIRDLSDARAAFDDADEGYLQTAIHMCRAAELRLNQLFKEVKEAAAEVAEAK